MNRILKLISLFTIFIVSTAFLGSDDLDLRALYAKPVKDWPKPTIDSGVNWAEFKALPMVDASFLKLMEEPKVKLGKILFFDPLLSGSGQISCSSCHDPQMAWADKRSVAIGNDHASGTRNSISLLNVAERKTFFWDGRATTLEDQAKEPIEAHHEMAMDPRKVGQKIGKIKEYQELFEKAFGSKKVDYAKIKEAIAIFEKTIVSRQSRFDQFLNGNYKALNDQELQGLHLFRNKARCMNCHNGQYFTNEEFHNIGLTYYKRKYEDLGRYNITKNPDDVGKFRTPSLRDVMHTGPWMHNGLFNNMTGIINLYNSGMHMNDPKAEQKIADPLYPVADPLLKPLNLTSKEVKALVAFLESISGAQYNLPRPVLPRK